ncbi:MAG: hypothetical protein CMP11_04960 [Zetaproteobacteria bacterium]|nr:hypothetical protein [Pseudobdellovibrionaceae bacterium]|tara:strand:+ start:1160 stop:1993 length:834 start_codon:yes stop_codon:yes gene_type:complete
MYKKRQTLLSNKIFFLCVLALSSCQGGKVNKLRNDLFRVQTRLLDLEHSSSGQDKSSQNSTIHGQQKLASAVLAVDDLSEKLRQLEGQIDALRIGVLTGTIPGDPLGDHGLSGQLEMLRNSLHTLENTQGQILQLLEQADIKEKKKSSVKKAVSRSKLITINEVKKAFKDRRYLHIAEDVPEILGTEKDSKIKLDLRYFYSESLFKLGRLTDAAVAYSELSKETDPFERTAKIHLRLGDCFRFLGDKETAQIYYSELLATFPDSQEARLAKNHLDKF